MQAFLDRLKQIPTKIVEWWKKFDSRQRTILICVVVGVIVALAILVTVLTKKNYITLIECEDTATASEVVELLEEEGITYKTSTSGLVISILEKDEATANLLLGSNSITTSGMTIDDVVSGGFSTTESDKQKRYIVYLQEYMAEVMESNAAVKKAVVSLDIPEDDGTLIASSTDSYAAITLELCDELTEEAATALARFAATALGNDDTNNITIIDTDGNLLYYGNEDSSSSGISSSSQLSMKTKAEEAVVSSVKSVLLGTDLYDSIEVASNLDLDFSTSTYTEHNYTPADGQSQGVLSSEQTYESEATGGTGGVPGTTSNDSDEDTTYVISDYDTSSETVTETSRSYLPNESLLEQVIPAGLINYDSSSISVAAKVLKVYREEDVKSQGLLTDITWDEFKLANEDSVKLEVDDEIYAIVQNATGIPSENITIVAYEVPVFIDKDGVSVNVTDIVQIIIIILILGLLAFVILTSMRSEKAAEGEEELSVESLLQSTPADVLEDIELAEKSETRKMIEKFVDENPEAVASLLRNWLQDEWG